MTRDRKPNDLLPRMKRKPVIHWFFLALALGVAIYFGYQIFKAASTQLKKIQHVEMVKA